MLPRKVLRKWKEQLHSSCHSMYEKEGGTRKLPKTRFFTKRWTWNNMNMKTNRWEQGILTNHIIFSGAEPVGQNIIFNSVPEVKLQKSLFAIINYSAEEQNNKKKLQRHISTRSCLSP